MYFKNSPLRIYLSEYTCISRTVPLEIIYQYTHVFRNYLSVNTHVFQEQSFKNLFIGIHMYFKNSPFRNYLSVFTCISRTVPLEFIYQYTHVFQEQSL